VFYSIKNNEFTDLETDRRIREVESMVSLYEGGVYLVNGTELVPEKEAGKVEALTGKAADRETAKKGTIAYSILKAHNTTEDMEHLKLRFDSMASHDITFVGIVQTAKASGMEQFPIPYVLTNCHNTLCAVGGTINEDDHMFGLSAAKKYGGIYVPPHIAVIHQYMRERMAGCGKMILMTVSVIVDQTSGLYDLPFFSRHVCHIKPDFFYRCSSVFSQNIRRNFL
jgi:aconitase A